MEEMPVYIEIDEHTMPDSDAVEVLIGCKQDTEVETWEERDARCRHTPGSLLAYALDDQEANS